MKKFLTQIIVFCIICCLCGEVIIRVFKLVSDIPQRSIDVETGLQLYKPGQSGYYKQADEAWNVNDYGWVGVANTDKKNQFSVIGDSYIENFMNPISCNQGYILQTFYKENGFFEAGRSGVSFIEALEISKKLDKDINPKYHLVYLNNNDFKESVTSKGRLTDIVQINLDKEEVLKAQLKSPIAKKILYSTKLGYYFYTRFPLFIAKQNIGETKEKMAKEKTEFDIETYKKLFEYCTKNYDKEKFVFVFHPGINKEFLTLSETFGFKYIALDPANQNWDFSEVDSHWSCFGHEQAALQVKKRIDSLEF